MTTLQQAQPYTPGEAALSTTPIRSHRSYEPHVEMVCHHSGRYLTRAETNPTTLAFLREQHDFPGFKELDDLFLNASHDRQHTHVIWNKAGVEGVAMTSAGIMLLVGTLYLARLSDQWGYVIEFALLWLMLVVGGFGGLTLLVLGIQRVSQRNAIFHRQAQGKHPEVWDFPLLCSYHVNLLEKNRSKIR